MATYNKLDTSLDLLIFRYKNGIRLIRPDAVLPKIGNTGLSLKDLLAFPANAYCLNLKSKYVVANEEIASTFLVDSPKSMIGKSSEHFFTQQTAALLLYNDDKTFKESKLQILEESAARKSNQQVLQALSIKSPIYDNDQVVGLFGVACMYGSHSVAELLTKVAMLGFLSQHQFIASLDDKYAFSSREVDIIQLLVRGYNAKIIAELFNLSVRTVEHHIENIKRKLNVNSKYELLIRLENMYGQLLK